MSRHVTYLAVYPASLTIEDLNWTSRAAGVAMGICEVRLLKRDIGSLDSVKSDETREVYDANLAHTARESRPHRAPYARGSARTTPGRNMVCGLQSIHELLFRSLLSTFTK